MSVRVVVTGIGLETAFGGADHTIRRVLAGERAFAPLSLFDVEGYGPHQVAAADVRSEPLEGRWRSRADVLALRAAREALGGSSPVGVDLIVASSVGGMLETERAMTRAHLGEPFGLPRAALRCHPVTAPADVVHEALGPFRSVRTVVSACSSGALAIGLALGRLRRGLAEAVLVGGTDALSVLTFSGFFALRSLDPGGARPFDRGRAGLALGEGAAFLLLETDARARDRKAKAFCECAGFAVACEAAHLTQPEASGETALRVMQQALEDAGDHASRVAWVSAHGTGTPRNDEMEAAVLARVVPAAWVSSQKAQLGHTLAAAGAVEAAIAVKALAEGRVPPSAGLVDPLPDVKHAPRGLSDPRPLALSNAFGFGGTDATLVFRRERTEATASRATPVLAIVRAAAMGPLGTFSGKELAELLSPDPRPPSAPAEPSRRVDPTSRLTVALATLVAEGAPRGAAVVSTSAFGAADRATEFLARVDARGPRLAPPVEFPTLVPSSPAAHTSIALDLHGASLTVADLGAGAVAALATAWDLIADGHAPAALAIAAEAPSPLAEALLTPDISEREGARAWGGAAFSVAPADAASPSLARVLRAEVVRGDLPPPPEGAVRVVATHVDRRVAAWAERSGVRLEVLPAALGAHEAASGLALAAAAGLVAAGELGVVVVLAPAPDRVGVAWLAR